MINIVLHEPEIPANTGNIGRTCVITGTSLHLIRPLGFMINDKMLKRAGLDYWDRLDYHEHLNVDAFYKYVSETAAKINSESMSSQIKTENMSSQIKLENMSSQIKLENMSSQIKPENMSSQIKLENMSSQDNLKNASFQNNDASASDIYTPRIFYATTKARKRYTDVTFHDGDYIMFGKESAGIPEEILIQHPEDAIRIPMLPEERSLNLANSVSIILYEALRQLDFLDLEDKGNLHRLSW